MSGGYISCGSFEGDDKSGAAYQGVLEALGGIDNRQYTLLVAKLREDLDKATEYVEITSGQAKELLPAILAYRAEIEDQLGGPKDPFEIIASADKDLDPVEAKWGQGLGWRYYCVVDLATALQVAISEDEAAIISFD